jgi:hypothetical protein
MIYTLPSLMELRTLSSIVYRRVVQIDPRVEAYMATGKMS